MEKLTSPDAAAAAIQSVAAATEAGSVTNTLMASILAWLRAECVRLDGVIDEQAIRSLTARLEAMPDGRVLSSYMSMLAEMAGEGDSVRSWDAVLTRLARAELAVGDAVDTQAICHMVGVQPFDRVVYTPEETGKIPGAICFSVKEGRFYSVTDDGRIIPHSRYHDDMLQRVRPYVYRSRPDGRLYLPDASGSRLDPFVSGSDMRADTWLASDTESGLMPAADKAFVDALAVGADAEDAVAPVPYVELMESVAAAGGRLDSLASTVDGFRPAMFAGVLPGAKLLMAQPVGTVAWCSDAKAFFERTDSGVEHAGPDYNFTVHGMAYPRRDRLFMCGGMLYRVTAADNRDLVPLADATEVETARMETPGIVCEIVNGKLLLHGAEWYAAHGYVPYLFRRARKRNRYRKAGNGRKPDRLKGWHLFGSRHTVRYDSGSGAVLFRDSEEEDMGRKRPRHDLPATAYAAGPEAIVRVTLGKNGLMVPYGQRTVKVADADGRNPRTTRLLFGIGFAAPNDDPRATVKVSQLVSNLAKFSIVIDTRMQVCLSR